MGDGRWWEPTWPGTMAAYAVVLRAFIERRLSGVEFETAFLSMFKRDETTYPEAQFGALDRLFAQVDDYCFDDELRREVGGLDEQGLREAACRAFDRLEALLTGSEEA